MPTKAKLTDATVLSARLPEGRSELMLWDAEVTGFGLRVRSTSKSWVVQYRPAGHGRSVTAKRFKLGTPKTIATATEARRLARDVLGRVARGEDPAAERAEAKRAANARVGDLIDAYEVRERARGRANVNTVLGVIRRGMNSFVDRDVRTLQATELVEVIDKMTAAGQPGAAADFRAKCRAFLSWCRDDRKVLEANPLLEHRRQRPTRTQRLVREEPGRALSLAEARALWGACGEASIYHRYLRFVLLTGCRRTEAAKISREMVNRDPDGASVLVLPKSVTKNGRDHRVPVTPQLQAVLDACPIDARSSLSFPAPRTGNTLTGWSKMHAAFTETSGLSFTLHDLRRTFKTGLDALGVEADISELCVNHVRKGLEGVYNRNEARDEVRSAFRKWANAVAPEAPEAFG